MKTATCISAVPAVLTDDNVRVEVGTVVDYKKVAFCYGEHHLVLADNKQVPAVFFDLG
jgi:hypothetical protein